MVCMKCGKECYTLTTGQKKDVNEENTLQIHSLCCWGDVGSKQQYQLKQQHKNIWFGDYRENE